MSTLGIFDNLLEDPIVGMTQSSFDSDDKVEKLDLLSTTMHESGLFGQEQWGGITDEGDDLLNAILTGSDSVSTAFDKPLSDTSSDSGCNGMEQQVLSPEPGIVLEDIMDYISHQDTDDDQDTPIHAVVNPRTNSPEPETISPTITKSITNTTTSFDTGATTIILPVITPKTVKIVKAPVVKRRRISASSNDSGVDDSPKQTASLLAPKVSKYPALELTPEERKICERENIKLPSHYPLSREEERNLKRIRRKIRNKVSAQDSRKRKKEYLDCMEDRVRQCTEENDELHKRIEQLESQNKTLAGQLRRLHQVIVNGGFTNRQNQTSTAMMVLLLSTALFLVPGMRDHQEPQKSELDISRAIKVPPMPGQSRSLLQFAPAIKDDFSVVDDVDAVNGKKNNILAAADEAIAASSFHDHDYFVVSGSKGRGPSPPPGKKKKVSYIEEDVPPQGYGFQSSTDGVKVELLDQDVYVVVDENSSDKVDRRLNVNVTGSAGSGTRTVVLHVPKEIK